MLAECVICIIMSHYYYIIYWRFACAVCATMPPVSKDPIRRIQVSRLAHPTAVVCLVGQDVTGTLNESNFLQPILFSISRSPVICLHDSFRTRYRQQLVTRYQADYSSRSRCCAGYQSCSSRCCRKLAYTYKARTL